MKTFIGIWLLLPVIALAGDQIKPSRTRYPVVGLACDELQLALSAAAAEIPPTGKVGFVQACTDSVLVGTLIIRNGESTPGEDIVLKSKEGTWTIVGQVETGRERGEAGVLVTELHSVLRTLPSGSLVLSVEVKMATKIAISTGRVGGPLAGSGQYFEYERKDGNWQKTKQGNWIS